MTLRKTRYVLTVGEQFLQEVDSGNLILTDDPIHCWHSNLMWTDRNVATLRLKMVQEIHPGHDWGLARVELYSPNLRGWNVDSVVYLKAADEH